MNANQSPDDLIDEAELASWLKCKPAALRKWRLLGKGPQFKKAGHLVRYRRGDVQAWLDASTYTSTTCRAEPVAA
ncbi:helix-turn-helix transcriptional regulator [Roseateles sp. BYS96W]|uniref:Helix-turn-helix transcriptional regulator n=1 Tax=Pelomonas nitida TaxID=3299027 RepID=A0ABW7GA53_9BURK